MSGERLLTLAAYGSETSLPSAGYHPDHGLIAALIVYLDDNPGLGGGRERILGTPKLSLGGKRS
jgi:hypothetical protein